MNLFFGQKDMLSFSKIMHVVHCITFATSGQNVLVGNIIDVHLFFMIFQKFNKECV
jgi:hypothetical protein